MVLTSKVYEGRLLRQVALQAVKCGRGSWLRNIDKCIEKFVWQDMSGEGHQQAVRVELE